MSRLAAESFRAAAAVIVVALMVPPAAANRPLYEPGAHDIPAWVKNRVELQLGDRSREESSVAGPRTERDS